MHARPILLATLLLAASALAATATPSTPPVSQSYNLLFARSGAITFTLPENQTGNATAVLGNLPPLPVRSDRPACVTLERTAPTTALVARKGVCGLNLVLQTNVNLEPTVLMDEPLDDLPAGDYRLSFTADVQPSLMTLTADWS